MSQGVLRQVLLYGRRGDTAERRRVGCSGPHVPLSGCRPYPVGLVFIAHRPAGRQLSRCARRFMRCRQDFDLSDALGDNDKKPTAPPKKPSPDDDGFSLEDALGGGGNNDPMPPNPPKPKPNPNPKQPGSSGGFSDSDLVDGASDGGGGGGGGGGSQRPDGEEQADSPGVVPGIIGAVVVAVAGAISSFIAYQKKKLCFKENADQGDTSTKNQQSTNAEQPVQWTLLEK
nr:CD99 antigen [Vulpes vulpes]